MLIISTARRTALVLLRFAYNLMRMRLRVGFIESIEKWIETENLKNLPFDCHPAAWSKRVGTEIELFKIDGRVVSRNEFRLFNEIKWSLFKELRIFYLSHAYVMGPDAIVMSSDRRIFKELTYPRSSRIWRYKDLLSSSWLPSSTTKIGWYTSLTCPTSYNYFHWMLECLPRLAVLEEYLKLFDGVIVPSNPSPFHLESLDALGIGAERLVQASPELHLRLEHFFTSNYSARDNPPPWLHHWYKSKFIDPLHLDVKQGRKVYVSRDDASFRKVSNSEEIHAMIAGLGFEVVTLSNMSFAEQAKLFYSSDVIVGEHGAGLTNLLFCRKGTKVVEIFSAFWIAPCFYAIAESAGLEYHFHIAESVEICWRVGNEIVSKDITKTLDANKSKAYAVKPDDLRRKILEVMG